MNEYVSIVIQGSGNGTPAFLDGLNHYNTLFGTVIIATNGPLPDDVRREALRRCPRAIITDTGLSEAPKNVYNQGNIYLQASSTLSGICRAHFGFVVKTRTDEYYGNLVPVVQKLGENPKKIVCTDVYFFCDRVGKYHISDHLIATDKHTLTTAMDGVVRECETTLAKSYLLTTYIPPEQIIAHELFKAKEIDPTAENSVENMRENIIIVPRTDLKPYTISTTVKKAKNKIERLVYTDLDDTFPSQPGAIHDIKDIAITEWDEELAKIPYFKKPEYDWVNDTRWQNDDKAIAYRRQMMESIRPR